MEAKRGHRQCSLLHSSSQQGRQSQTLNSQNSEILQLHWLWESSVPLPGCPLHSGTPSLPVPSPICAVVLPWSFSLGICVPFSHHVCVLHLLCLFRGRIIFYIPTHSLIIIIFSLFYGCLSYLLFLDIFPLLLSSLPSFLGLLLVFLFILLLSNPSPRSMRIIVVAWDGIVNLVPCAMTDVCGQVAVAKKRYTTTPQRWVTLRIASDWLFFL